MLLDLGAGTQLVEVSTVVNVAESLLGVCSKFQRQVACVFALGTIRTVLTIDAVCPSDAPDAPLALGAVLTVRVRSLVRFLLFRMVTIPIVLPPKLPFNVCSGSALPVAGPVPPCPGSALPVARPPPGPH